MSYSQFSGNWWFQVLKNYFKIYAWLLHSAFNYSQLGEDVAKRGGWRLCISHVHYIADHGKSWENHGIVFLIFCGNPVIFCNSSDFCL